MQKIAKAISAFYNAYKPYVRLTIVAIILIALSYGLVNFASSYYKKSTDKLVLGWKGQLTHLNPLFAPPESLGDMPSRLVYRSLITFDNDSHAVGDLVDYWELSDNGKIYTVFLKEGQTWQDGEPITTDDVAFTYTTILNNPEIAKSQAFLKEVDIQIVNDYQIKFTLKQPFSPFLSLLTIGILPKHIWSEMTFNEMQNSQYNFKPIGSGIYAVDSYDLQEGRITEITLKAKSKEISPQTIIVKLYDTDKDLVNAFKLGKINSFIDYQGDTYTQFKDWANVHITDTGFCNQSITLFFNLDEEKEKNETILDKDFRSAIYNLLKTYDPQISLFVSPLPVSHWAYTNVAKDEKTLSREEALKAIKPYVGEDELKLTVVDRPETKKVLSVIKTALEEAGFKIKVNTIKSQSAIAKTLIDHDFDMILIPQQFNHDPDQYGFWHSTQTDYSAGGLNVSGYADRRTDKALEDARTSNDEKVRKEAYAKVQERLYLDKPAIFIARDPVRTVTRINTINIAPQATCIWGIGDYFKEIGKKQ